MEVFSFRKIPKNLLKLSIEKQVRILSFEITYLSKNYVLEIFN